MRFKFFRGSFLYSLFFWEAMKTNYLKSCTLSIPQMVAIKLKA